MIINFLGILIVTLYVLMIFLLITPPINSSIVLVDLHGDKKTLTVNNSHQAFPIVFF
jgi:hypothetical protein